MLDLLELRTHIDRIDRDISALVVERMEVSKAIAEYKLATGKPLFDAEREMANIAAARKRVPEELADYAETIQSTLMEASRSVQQQVISQQADGKTSGIPNDGAEVE